MLSAPVPLSAVVVADDGAGGCGNADGQTRATEVITVGVDVAVLVVAVAVGDGVVGCDC